MAIGIIYLKYILLVLKYYTEVLQGLHLCDHDRIFTSQYNVQSAWL